MQKVYISSTYKDFKEYRTTLISLFHKQLKGKFELCEIMEHMFDDGSSSTYVEECVAAVKECDIYFIILGNSVGSYPPNESRTYTEIEYQTAMEEDKFIYRLQLENIDEKTIDDPVKHKALRDSFEGKHVTYFNDEAELEGIFLKSLLNHFKEINTENPYRGMDPFQISDGEYFFGREQEIEKFIKLVLTTENERVFSVCGDSGLGKSSFIRAGVMHRMLEEEVMGYSAHIPLTVRPGEQPMTNLKYQLRRHAGIHGQNLSAKDFEGAKLLLFAHHLEELYTQGHSEAAKAEKDAFIKLMNELASHPNLDIVIFLTYRSDFAETLAQHAFVGQHAREFELKSFDFRKNNAQWEQSITEIITAPAEKHGVSLESELVSSLIQELEDLDGCLPILQMTLYQIWDPKVIKDHQIKYSELLKLSRGKGLIGLLQNHANSVTSKITKKGKDKVRESILKSMLLNLVEVSDEHGDLKRTLSKKKLFEKLDHYPALDVEGVFEDLVSHKSRLLLVSGREVNCDPAEGSEKGACVTLVHEELITKWPKLQQWVEERRDALKLQKRLIRDVRDFEEKKGSLYRGKRLRNAVVWQSKNKDFYDHSIKRFLHKSKVSQLFIFSIPFLLGILLTLFYFIAFRPYIQKNQFLDNVVNARPEMLKNFLNAKADLAKAQTLSLVSGSLDELNSEYSVQYNIPLKRNLRYFGNVEGLQLMNNSRIERFEQVKDQMKSQTAFATLKNNLRSLSLVHLNNLTSLDGIDELDNIHRLTLKENLRLDFNKEISLPAQLEFLEFWDNDGLRGIPDLGSLEKLDTLHLVGNDALEHFDMKLPANLSQLLISGNSLLEDIQGLSQSSELKWLKIDYNDNLGSIDSLAKLTKLEYLAVENNPSMFSIPPLNTLDSLKTLRIGLDSIGSLPTLPRQLTSIALNGNHKLSRINLYGLRQLKKAEITNNSQVEALNLPPGLESVKISANDALERFKWNASALKKVEISRMAKLLELPSMANSTVNHLILDSLPRLTTFGPRMMELRTSLDSLEMHKVGGHWFDTSLEAVAPLEKLRYFKVHGSYLDFNLNVAEDDQGKLYRALEELIIHGYTNDTIRKNYFGPTVSGIPSLKKLSFENNRKWRIVRSLNLTNLEVLRFYNNSRLRILPRLNNLPRLQEVHIESNNSLSRIPDFSGNPELRTLTLKRNRNIRNYNVLGKLNQLQKLELSHIDLYLNNLDFLKEMHALEDLSLINNRNLEDISAIDSTTGIKRLRVIQNFRLLSLPDMRNLPALERLEVTSNTNLTDTLHISNEILSGLDRLVIYGNSELVFDQEEVKILDWSKAKLTHLELDTKTFKKLFVDTDLLKKTRHLSKRNSDVKLERLIIHLDPKEDIRSLDLIGIQEKNPDLQIELLYN